MRIADFYPIVAFLFDCLYFYFKILSIGSWFVADNAIKTAIAMNDIARREVVFQNLAFSSAFRLADFRSLPPFQF